MLWVIELFVKSCQNKSFGHFVKQRSNFNHGNDLPATKTSQNDSINKQLSVKIQLFLWKREEEASPC